MIRRILRTVAGFTLAILTAVLVLYSITVLYLALIYHTFIWMGE